MQSMAAARVLAVAGVAVEIQVRQLPMKLRLVGLGLERLDAAVQDFDRPCRGDSLDLDVGHERIHGKILGVRFESPRA